MTRMKKDFTSIGRVHNSPLYRGLRLWDSLPSDLQKDRHFNLQEKKFYLHILRNTISCTYPKAYDTTVKCITLSIIMYSLVSCYDVKSAHILMSLYPGQKFDTKSVHIISNFNKLTLICYLDVLTQWKNCVLRN